MPDELGAVVDGNELDALGEAGFDLPDLLLHAPDDIEGVLALPHDDDSRDGLPGSVQVGDATPEIRSKRYLPDVPHSDWGAILTGEEDHVFEVGNRLGITAAADHVLSAADLDHAAPGFVVAAANRFDHPVDGNVVGPEPVRVHVHLVLFAEAADGSDLGHAGDGFKVVAQVPILNRAQIRQALLTGLVLEHILVDPAESRGVRPEFGPGSLGKRLQDAGKVLEGAGAGPVDVGAIFKDDVDERVAEIGKAADGLDLGGAEHGADDRVGDLVLDDVGAAVPARVDDDLRVAEVGDGVQGDMVHRPPAVDGGSRDQGEYDEAITRGKIDDARNHAGPRFAEMYLAGAASKRFLHCSEQKV